MDETLGLSGSPVGGPLQTMSPDGVNRRDSMFSSLRGEGRDSPVHDKINQFNSLSIAMQSKHLERKTADAALRRALVGREEAEAELRKLREEANTLKKQVGDGRERERKVGERLEAVMENYGRIKETHAHTQALWEKEIRRARKENFKSQSTIVKLQEELKSTRSSTKSLQENLEREKERTKAREQEAFTARYEIVGVQEKLDEALERIKLVEQERDAFKTAAKNEEVARIAAEGRIPLPAAQDPADEFASPRRKAVPARRRSGRKSSRVSLTTMEIMSSAASEMEIEELSTQVLWERQRADRAQEMIEFLQAECQMRLCSCGKSMDKAQTKVEAPHKRRKISARRQAEEEVTIKEESDSPQSQRVPSACSLHSSADVKESAATAEQPAEQPRVEELDLQRVRSRKEPRRSTIFLSKEGIFRTVSEQEAAAVLETQKMAVVNEVQTAAEALPMTEAARSQSPRAYARTPSVDPPAFALLSQERNSIDFLLDAPEDQEPMAPLPHIPVVADGTEPVPPQQTSPEAERSYSPAGSPEPAAHHGASTASYTVTTTVPLREDTARSSTTFNERLRTPSAGSAASFDSNDPAMTPTMTREQALAKIRERRGRARSAADAAKTTTTTTSTGTARGRSLKRDVSAPTTRATPRFK